MKNKGGANKMDDGSHRTIMTKGLYRTAGTAVVAMQTTVQMAWCKRPAPRLIRQDNVVAN